MIRLPDDDDDGNGDGDGDGGDGDQTNCFQGGVIVSELSRSVHPCHVHAC